MVKVIRLQKPLPNAVLTAIGEAPLIRAASATTTTAIATKIKASGNQRSAHAVKAIASRTSGPSCCVAPPVGAAAVLVIAMMNPSQDPTLERLSRPCPQRRRQAGWAPLLQCPHVADDASALQLSAGVRRHSQTIALSQYSQAFLYATVRHSPLFAV